MNLAPETTASKLRALKARGLQADAYLDAVVHLAAVDLDDDNDAIDRAEQIVALRGRIAVLRKRLRELEAHK